ncbi:MAG: ribosome biogenesis GTPase YlqF [Clostridia bacterium]|nr:ribosome biogenesis GTPase YlqF [Clostridia bacterium]
MVIQWFPGHMTKALRMIDENVKIVDGFIYVLDARAPYSSLNPEFVKRINNKPYLYVINKCDLADPKKTRAWVEYFQNTGKPCVSLNSVFTNSSRIVYQEVLKMFAEKIERQKQKGVSKPIRLMVLGIPNSGKSTLINNLCGQKRANTGDKPGITRGKQWINVDDKIQLLDTPGTLFPSFENQDIAKCVAYIGSINDDILDIEGLALELIGKLSKIYPDLMKERYGVELSDIPLETYEAICKKRGFILRGKEFDYTRGAKTVIDEFRKGKIGNITLETPNEEYVRN